VPLSLIDWALISKCAVPAVSQEGMAGLRSSVPNTQLSPKRTPTCTAAGGEHGRNVTQEVTSGRDQYSTALPLKASFN
jgi:hypothetical protein